MFSNVSHIMVINDVIDLFYETFTTLFS